jgi:hypothetical protein
LVPAVVSGSPPLITATIVDAICTAASTFVSSLHASDFQLGVPATTMGTGGRGEAGVGVPNRRFQSIQQVQVDNVIDVIRRRRVHRPTYYKRLP